MTTIEHYLLSAATAERFQEFRTDQSYYSEEYAMNEFLNNAGVKGFVTRIKKQPNGKIRARMCIDVLYKKTNQFYFEKLNHDLNDQR